MPFQLHKITNTVTHIRTHTGIEREREGDRENRKIKPAQSDRNMWRKNDSMKPESECSPISKHLHRHVYRVILLVLNEF